MDNKSKPHRSWLFQQLAVDHRREVKTLWPVPKKSYGFSFCDNSNRKLHCKVLRA